MAKKRFMQPNWRVLSKLSDELFKCYIYCWNKSDDAGVYELDVEYMEADIKFHLSIDELLKLPDVKKIGAKKFLFKDFMLINYNGLLKSGYNPHKPIFRAIEAHGKEHFLDLDINVESGVKEDKKIQAIKSFFKLENNFSSLLNVNVNVNGNDNKGEGAGEGDKGQVTTVASSQMLLPQMFTIWKKENPNYASLEEQDFTGLRLIAQFISGRKGIEHIQNSDLQTLMEKWGKWCKHIRGSTSCNDSLLTIGKFKLQKIHNEITNGTVTTKSVGQNNTGRPSAQIVSSGGFGTL